MLAGVNVPNHVRSCRLKNEVWSSCSKLTGDLPQGKGCLPWRWQVPTTILQGAVQVWVNVSNHIRSRRPLMMHHPGQGKAGRTLVSALPLKNWTQANLPKTHRGPSPRQGLPPLKMASPYHHPSRSSTSASKCAKSRHAGWKMKFGWSAQNSQGTCPMVGAISPEDRRSIPKTPLKQRWLV